MNFPKYEQHPEAVEELAAAVRWYADRNWEVADGFIERIRKLLSELQEWPGSGRLWPDWFREPKIYSYDVPGYPYRVIYFLRVSALVVVAYAHEKREPGYWKDRVDTMAQNNK